LSCPKTVNAWICRNTSAVPALYPQPSEKQLLSLYAEVVRNWRRAGFDVSLLNNTKFRLAGLPGDELGLANGRIIWIDVNASGHGWFIDPTPRSNAEFRQPGNPGEQGHIDPLTVLAHEVGHVLGLDHHDDLDGMAAFLATGVRPLPGRDQFFCRLLP
jgi:hypothetical protein